MENVHKKFGAFQLSSNNPSIQVLVDDVFENSLLKVQRGILTLDGFFVHGAHRNILHLSPDEDDALNYKNYLFR